MPIYEFACKTCGEPCEMIMKSGDVPSNMRCKLCGGGLERKLSVFSFRESDSSRYKDVDYNAPYSYDYLKGERNIGNRARKMLLDAGVKNANLEADSILEKARAEVKKAIE